MAEDWVKDACSEARAAFEALFEFEVELGALKENQSKLAKQLKEAVRLRNSSKAGLKTTKKQAEDLRKQLHYQSGNRKATGDGTSRRASEGQGSCPTG